MTSTVCRDKMARRSASNKYLIILFVSVALYLFFFATGSFFPYTGKLYETPLWTTSRLSDRTALTLKRWEYDPAQQLMEVELSVEDSYYNYRTQLAPTAMTRKLSPLPVQVTVSSRELLVLHINSIPTRFEAVALTVTADTGESPVKFYCDARSVAKTDLAIGSEMEYRRLSLESDILWLESQLQDSAAAIENYIQRIQLFQSDIEVLEQKKESQTAAARQQTEQYIRQKKLEIEGELNRISKEQERQKGLTESLDHTRNQLKNS